MDNINTSLEVEWLPFANGRQFNIKRVLDFQVHIPGIELASELFRKTVPDILNAFGFGGTHIEGLADDAHSEIFVGFGEPFWVLSWTEVLCGLGFCLHDDIYMDFIICVIYE